MNERLFDIPESNGASIQMADVNAVDNGGVRFRLSEIGESPDGHDENSYF